jgi:hypothetical protein
MQHLVGFQIHEGCEQFELLNYSVLSLQRTYLGERSRRKASLGKSLQGQSTNILRRTLARPSAVRVDGLTCPRNITD